MESKIYVGNLSFDSTEKDIKELFAKYGKVKEVEIIKDRFSGRPKGFGFVTFEDREGMEKAISEMNGKEFQGREIRVSEAKPREPGTGGGFGGDGPRRSFRSNRDSFKRRF